VVGSNDYMQWLGGGRLLHQDRRRTDQIDGIRADIKNTPTKDTPSTYCLCCQGREYLVYWPLLLPCSAHPETE
jgi:hypothetical protein